MVQSFANGLSNLSSYFWTNTNNSVTVGNTNVESAPQFTEEVKKQDIVKEGYLYKQSRYMKTWKK